MTAHIDNIEQMHTGTSDDAWCMPCSTCVRASLAVVLCPRESWDAHAQVTPTFRELAAVRWAAVK